VIHFELTENFHTFLFDKYNSLKGFVRQSVCSLVTRFLKKREFKKIQVNSSKYSTIGWMPCCDIATLQLARLFVTDIFACLFLAQPRLCSCFYLESVILEVKEFKHGNKGDLFSQELGTRDLALSVHQSICL